MKPDILFLVHRIPYPPNKGDKIRSFHILRYLSDHYRVHLGTFVDAKDDWEHVGKVKEYCASSCFVGLDPLPSKMMSLTGLITGKAMTLPYYASPRLSAWVRQAVPEHGIKRILVFSSAMAQFVLDRGFEHARRIIDFVDVDSDKWRQYAESKTWPMSWIYRRESENLLRFESRVSRAFDASLFVSAAEADVFKKLSGLYRESVGYMNNGVDTAFFSPDNGYENPFPDRKKVLVFVGAMDYWANVEAVSWFARDILPVLRTEYPDVRFYIVGSRPTETVQRLNALPGVVITGAVPDVRPYLHYASAVVAPLRIARGIQNKVLEAMAMAKPIAATRQALEGLNVSPGNEVFEVNSVQDFAQRLREIFESGAPNTGRLARDKVCAEYNWPVSLQRLGRLLESQEA